MSANFIKKILLLGSGELGKEFVLSAKRLGQYVVAVDDYANAPAMSVADEYRIINMLEGNELAKVVSDIQPDIIVPEVEALRTEKLFEFEAQGIQIVPSAKAVNLTMNRRGIRDLVASELGLKTAKFFYAKNIDELKEKANKLGYPCVLKPLMSSSGKGQGILNGPQDISSAWDKAIKDQRGDGTEVICEEYIPFDSEITLLTITQKNAPTLFCAPIGHYQERGDYQHSWQPHTMSSENLQLAQEMADKITKTLGGVGLWGVEFFLHNNEVYFSELSPRPHDTGMVTLGNTQNFNEFELHIRAILGLPIHKIHLQKCGVSAVITSPLARGIPQYVGCQDVFVDEKVDLRIFGKPTLKNYRRMGVVVVNDQLGSDIPGLIDKAKSLANKIKIETLRY